MASVRLASFYCQKILLHSHKDLLYLEHSPEEWRSLEDLYEILELFKDVTTYLSANLYTSLSAICSDMEKNLHIPI